MNKIWSNDLRNFFNNISSLRYAYLRFDSESIQNESELDILVHPLDRDELIGKIYDNFVLKNQYKIVNINISNFCSSVVVINKDYHLESYIKFDIRSAIAKNKRLLLSHKEVNWKKLKINDFGIKQLPTNIDAGLLILRNFHDNRKYNKKHKNILNNVSNMDLTSKWLYSKGYTLDINHVSVKEKSKFLHFLEYFRTFITLTYHKFIGLKKLKIKYPNIVLYGADGAGKTTIMRELSSNFIKLGLKTRTFHFFKEFNTSKNDFISKPAKTNIKIKQGLKSNRLIGSPIFIFSYFYKVIKHFKFSIFKKKHLIIINDRYFYDAFKKSNRLKHDFTFKFLSQITPKHEMSFILSGSPSLIRGRKPELSSDEIINYYSLLNKFLLNKNKFSIDINDSPKFISYEILDSFFQHYNEHIRKKL